MNESFDETVQYNSEEEALNWIKKFIDELQQIENFFTEKLDEKIKDFI